MQSLLARLRSESDFLLAQFFRDRDFLRVQTPAITSTDCEGAGEVFSVASEPSTPGLDSGQALDRQPISHEEAFFRSPKFLTVSAQLHLEAYMHEHPRVWTFAPTFRAERSDTPRHVSEFWMLEAELRTHSLEDIMVLVENMIKSLVQGLEKSPFIEELMIARRSWEKSEAQEPSGDENLISSRWEDLKHGAWPRITYTEATRLLQDEIQSGDSGFTHKAGWNTGLQLEHERYIAAKVGQGKPVFVTDYPQMIKPFYTLPSAAVLSQDYRTPSTAACFDLLLPELCEVVGGSLREHRLEQLMASMHHSDQDQPPNAQGASNQSEISSTPPEGRNNLDWYVDLRRFGSVPHGGFGFGFDRFLCYLTGMRNIKDVLPWPRYHGRCDC